MAEIEYQEDKMNHPFNIKRLNIDKHQKTGLLNSSLTGNYKK